MTHQEIAELPQPDIHPAIRIARELGASVVLPSPQHPDHDRSAHAKVNVSKTWACYGPERGF